MNEKNIDHRESKRPAGAAKVLRIVGMAVGGVILAVLLGFLFALLVKALWNWLMPTLFGLGTINYWQAFGIFVLAKLLFGGFPHHHDKCCSDHSHRKTHDKWHRWMESECCDADWKHFHSFWDEEGKAAFADYVKRTESDKEKD